MRLKLGVRFADQDCERRMEVILACDVFGCEQFHYTDGNLQLAMTTDLEAMAALRLFLTRIGMERIDSHYFPLGTDNPEDRYRHDGSYPGSKGFWRWDTFKVKEAVTDAGTTD